jgi:hypothetical protein
MLAWLQYFFANPINSSEMSIEINFSSYGKPIANAKPLNPVNVPTSMSILQLANSILWILQICKSFILNHLNSRIY